MSRVSPGCSRMESGTGGTRPPGSSTKSTDLTDAPLAPLVSRKRSRGTKTSDPPLVPVIVTSNNDTVMLAAGTCGRGLGRTIDVGPEGALQPTATTRKTNKNVRIEAPDLRAQFTPVDP